MSFDNTIALAALPPRRSRRTIILLAVASAVVVLSAGAGFVACTGSEEPDVPFVEEQAAGPAELEPIIFEWDGTAQAADGPEGEPEPIPFEESEQSGTGSADPCPGVTGDGLVVTPNPVKIISGNKGAIDIQNCGAEAVEWSATTVAWVKLDETQGSLPSGAIFRLLFTVQTASLPTGPYSFTIKVNDVQVPVSGTKLGGLVAPGGPTTSPVPTVGGLIAPGISPCAAQCIIEAQLSTLPGRADVTLEVRTNTPAELVAQVDTREPSYSKDGKPYFADPQVRVATDNRRSEWTVVLRPLEPDTKYHIVVAARDHLGGTSFQTASFRTQKVINQIAGNEPGGCSTNCVSHAQLTPIFGSPNLGIEVRTLVPTRIVVRVNNVAVAGTGNEYVTEWNDTLELQPGLSYAITLRVTDEQGRSQQHTAVATTPKPVADHQSRVLVTFHKIRVHDDADNTFFNRKGELTFRFEVDGEHQIGLDTAEHKIRAPEWVSLRTGDRAGRSVILEEAPDQLSLRVQGQERDNDKPGFCAAGTPFFEETAGRTTVGGCRELEWNTAEAIVDLHASNDGGALPPCHGFPDGIRGDICVVLKAAGEDPAFDVYVTIDFAD